MKIISIHYCRKKTFSFKINKLSTTDNIFNGKPSDVLYTWYLNKDISFGDIVYFESKNIQDPLQLYLFSLSGFPP